MDTPKENTGENTSPAATHPPIAAESPANTTPAETVTADQLAAPLAENMPVPTATENAQTEIPAVTEAIPAKPVPVVRDKSGKLFDPAKHAVDDLGQPRFNKNGFFVSKFIGNPGKKKDGGISSEQMGNPPENENPNPASKGDGVPSQSGLGETSAAFASPTGGPDQYDQTADLYLQVGYGLASSFLGDGIRPEFKVEKRTTGGPGQPDQIEEVIRYTAEGKQEHESLRLPLAAMLREKGSTGMTPTQMFLVSLGAFIAKKAAKPTVRERFLLLVLKFKSWFSKSKLPTAN